MVGSNSTLISIRLVRSKLRKREETSTDASPPLEAVQSNILPTSHHQRLVGDRQLQISTTIRDASPEQITYTLSNEASCNDGDESLTVNNWVFPPKAPTPNIYNCLNTDELNATNDKNGFKGFRKQFSGRFKRLVSKKPESSPAIPPELKPQLKTIYVY